MTTPTPLTAVASRYGLSPAALAARIEASGYDDDVEIENPAPDGHVERLRIKPLGRFGNVFAQLLHAMLVARALGVRRLAFPAYEPGPSPGEAAGIRLEPTAPDTAPTLAARFFWAAPFAQVLAPAREAEAMLAALAPRYAHLAPAAPAEEIAVHFRAGDVFGVRDPGGYDWIVPIYVQPPASYYQAAIARARAETGIARVRLVYEGRENPAVEATAAWLLAERIPFTAQSLTAADDLAALMAARVLVGDCGTFAEAAALLSPHLRMLWAFRTVECHAHIHARPEPLWARLLRDKGVGLRVLRDGGDYIAPLTWSASPEQLAMIRDYPVEKLSLAD
ncbi:MAG: hypothetical protein KGK10_01600 [Rhodospirillales bacterium]|nr:hypothetical protein [Rhodospirillales bacterium]